MTVARGAPKVVVFTAPAATTLDAVLLRLGADAEAVSEGRVFVGKTRATRADVPVAAGETVRLSGKAATRASVVPVLVRSEHLLVVEKPAGIPTIADGRSSAGSLVALAAETAGLAASSLHPTSRLDREVSGVVTFALSAFARDALARAREEGRYERRYVALAVRAPSPEAGVCDASLGRARDPRHRRVDPKGERARSRYVTVATAGLGTALLAFAPETGRTHQLRVHAAHLGASLLGDTTYGGPSRLVLPGGRVRALPRIYLHCARVRFALGDTWVEAESALPDELRGTWAAVGGPEEALERALARDILVASA